MKLLPNNRCRHVKGECYGCYLWGECNRTDKDDPIIINATTGTAALAILVIAIGVLAVILHYLP